MRRKKPDRVYARKVDGRGETHLIALACSEAPEGYGRWSLRLLSDRFVEPGYAESLSHESVRQVLKKRTQAVLHPAVGDLAQAERRLHLENGLDV